MPEFDFSSLMNNPLLQYGMGLLRASGPSTTPHSFGQDLASAYDYQQNAQKGNLTNEYLRAQTSEAQMKAKQLQAWQAMMGGGAPDAGVLAPQAQATQNGVLAPPPQQASPMAGILSDPRIAAIRPMLAGMGPEEGMKMIASQIVPKDPPAGYRTVAGGNLEAIPGGPATKLPGNEAAQMALLKTSLNNMPEIRKIFGPQFGLGNSWDYTFGAGDTGHGKRLVTAGVEAALRAMSGAAVPKEEVERYSQLYSPTPIDTETTRTKKLDELEKFMSSAADNMNQGRSGAPSGILAPQATSPAGPLSGQANAVNNQQMPQGAKMAPDGKFYVPDPNRPGKYLMVQ